MFRWFTHLSFVCLSHGGGSLALVSQNHAEQDVDSVLAFQLQPSHRRWIAKPCLGARFRATAVIREHSHIASTTESASKHTDAVTLFTGPATDWIGSVPAYWEQPRAALLRMPWVSTSQTGNNETPVAGDDLNSNAIVNAQLSHPISRDDVAQGQDAPNVPQTF